MVETIENLTLLEVSGIVVFIVGLIKGVKYLKKSIREFFQSLISDQFKVINDKLDELDTQSCKNFLVRYLADIERGAYIYDTERQRFWEEYDHYVDDLKGNSYIKEWVARLKEEGKLTR